MNKNIKIAKELIKLAKSLVASDERKKAIKELRDIAHKYEPITEDKIENYKSIKEVMEVGFNPFMRKTINVVEALKKQDIIDEEKYKYIMQEMPARKEFIKAWDKNIIDDEKDLENRLDLLDNWCLGIANFLEQEQEKEKK